MLLQTELFCSVINFLTPATLLEVGGSVVSECGVGMRAYEIDESERTGQRVSKELKVSV